MCCFVDSVIVLCVCVVFILCCVVMSVLCLRFLCCCFVYFVFVLACAVSPCFDYDLEICVQTHYADFKSSIGSVVDLLELYPRYFDVVRLPYLHYIHVTPKPI